MQRPKAMIASALVAATVMGSAVAYAAASGLTEGRRDNVGTLQPVTTVPEPSTEYVEPAAPVTPEPAANVSPTRLTPSERTGGDRDHHEGGAERGGDDDD